MRPICLLRLMPGSSGPTRALFRRRDRLRWSREVNRLISCSSVTGSNRMPSINDVKDVWKILKHDVVDGRLNEILPCPREADVLIIGGSLIGSSIAYFIKEIYNKMNVVVVEPDPTYSKAAALLSAGGMRQQFSCKENIEMSQFGYEFLRRADTMLRVNGEPPPNVNFNHNGYLIMADRDGVDDMLANHQLQRECGVNSYLLTNAMFQKKFPWMDSTNIELASLGKHGEGWFDPAALLSAFKGKARELGATYVQGKVVGFEHKKVKEPMGDTNKVADMALVELPNGDVQPVKSAIFINAAGAWAGQVAAMVGIGTETPEYLDCSVALPVEPRKRFIYYFDSPKGPGLGCPFTVDTSKEGNGVYWRREGLGNRYICGMCPSPDNEPDHSDLSVDYDFFNDSVWPALANRVSAFEELKVLSAWAGYYDYNYIDCNLIIGSHPYFKNFIFANGSSGHGLQHTAAIGRAVSELIAYQSYRTVNLDNLSFNRFLSEDDTGVRTEHNVY